MKNQTKFFPFLLMHLGFLIYASYTLLGKLAAKHQFLSPVWIAFYAGIIFVLAVYAVIWQQVLKNFALPVAMCNKAVTIVWGMLFSALLFGERITAKKLLGAAVILCGIVLLSAAGGEATIACDANEGGGEGGQ